MSMITLQTGMKLIEHTVVRCKFDRELNLDHARWLRGAIGQLIDRRSSTIIRKQDWCTTIR